MWHLSCVATPCALQAVAFAAWLVGNGFYLQASGRHTGYLKPCMPEVLLRDGCPVVSRPWHCTGGLRHYIEQRVLILVLLSCWDKCKA